MNNMLRQIALFAVALLIFAVMGTQIARKERTLTSGRTMLLELAPVDPRSLMQGDYMDLRYKAAQQVAQQGGGGRDGYLVMKVDDVGVATYQRVHAAGQPLAPGEHLLRFRRRGKGIRLGAESFFFQEGHAQYYSGARYGELSVDDAGNSVLAGLRGPNLEWLGPDASGK